MRSQCCRQTSQHENSSQIAHLEWRWCFSGCAVAEWLRRKITLQFLHCGYASVLGKDSSRWRLFTVVCGTGAMSLRRDPVSGISSKVVSCHGRPNKFVAIYYACATLSGAFGGLIAYGIQLNLASEGGRKPWSWLFLIEGVLAVGIGLIIILALPRFPDDLHRRDKRHWLFTSEEIDLAYKRYNGELHF